MMGPSTNIHTHPVLRCCCFIVCGGCLSLVRASSSNATTPSPPSMWLPRESLSSALVHCCTAADPSAPLLPCCIVTGCVGLTDAVRMVAEAEGMTVGHRATWLLVLLGDGAAHVLADART